MPCKPAMRKKRKNVDHGAYVRDYRGYGKGPKAADTLARAVYAGKAHFERNAHGGEYIVKKKKVPMVINNKMKGDFGATTFDKKNKATKVEINLKRHKGDEAELASTIKHELLHVKHPNMTEKEVYKRTRKTKIPEGEQIRLLAKLSRKKTNYKMGALKRKFKSGRDNQPPGTFINKAAEMSRAKKVGIMGAM